MNTELNTKELGIILEMPRAENKAEQGGALAQAYANKGFRDYLHNAIRNNILRLATVEDQRMLDKMQGRISILQELLGVSKQAFTDFEKLKNNATH